MDLNDRLEALEDQSQALADAVTERVAPAGWEPGIHWTGREGTISTGAMEAPPDPALWREILLDWGLDPEITELVPGSIEIRAWDAAIGGGVTQRMKYYKAKLRARITLVDGVRLDLEELYKEVRKAKPPKREKKDGSATLVVPLSDWQVGNRDGGGIQSQVTAIAELPDKIADRVADMRRAGHQIGTILITGQGDMCEGSCGFYPAQQFRIDIDRRDQIKVVRRGLRDIVMRAAPLAPKIVVACAPGNHGENRQNGKAFTTVGDNDDVAVFEQVAEILAANPDAYGHIDWRIPRDEVAVSVRVSDHNIAVTHGHVPKPSGGPVNAMWRWWEQQAMGRAYPGVADAEILICHTAETTVVCEDAIRPISEVKIGHRVLDHLGEWQTVIAVGSSEVDETVTLSGQAHPGITSTPDHPYLAYDMPVGAKKMRSVKSWGQVNAEDMVDQFWYNPTTFAAAEVPPIERGTPMSKVVDFSKEFWWMVGLWLAEGHTSQHEVAFSIHRDEMEEVSARLEVVTGTKPTVTSEHENSVQLLVCRTDLARWLNQHFGKYCHGKTIPGWALGMEEAYREELLAGLTFGDGHYEPANTRYEYKTVSRALAVGVRLLASSLGYATAMRMDKRAGTTGDFPGGTYELRDAYRVFYRKYTRWGGDFVIGDHRASRVKKITRNTGPQTVFNITVTGSHTFLADGIATHNCGHFHHLNVKEQQGRLLAICPSLTPVGEYWQDAHGTITRSGTLTFVVDHDGWGELSII